MSWLTDPLPAQHIDTDPYYQTAAEEQAQIEEGERAKADLREAVAAAFADYRGDIYLADVRQIVIEELNKLRPGAGEPEWQTKTPVPIPAMG